MSFALRELSQLLTAERLLVGSVVEVDGTQVRVATARGAVTARTLDVLAVGDRVHIQNGIASRAPSARAVFPV
ncbi:MAG: hypothetical protein ACK4SA_07230 [Caldilinea sp.]